MGAFLKDLLDRCPAVVLAACAWLSTGPLWDLGAGGAKAATDKPQILMLFSNESMMPAGEAIAGGFRETIAGDIPDRLLWFAEYLDADRFPGPEHQARMVTFLRDKYRAAQIDLIVALGPQALKFLAQNKASLFPSVPIVFVGVSENSLRGLALPSSATGLVSRFDAVTTTELALKLQPDATDLVVVTGASSFDRQWESVARRELAVFEGRLKVAYLSKLPLAELLRRVGVLPRSAIVLFLTFLEDGTGEKFISRDVAEKVAAAASAPVYSMYDTYLGHGVVGGDIGTFEAMGIETARIAQRVLAGETPESIGPRTVTATANIVDWRQLRRWGLNESDLPPGTIVRFKELSLWDRHRGQIIAVSAVVVVQSLLLAGLLLQQRRRRHAEESLRQSEERISFAAESSNLGLWQMDAATYRIWATDHCRRILGLDPRAPVTRKSFSNAYHPEDRVKATRICEEAVAQAKSYEQEYRVVHVDGRVRWVLDRARSICDDTGKLVRMTGVVIDITERKQVEEALRHSEERYRDVVETQTELICRYLPDTTLTFVNDAYCRCFGRAREVLLGTKFIELIPERSRAATRQSVEALIANRRLGATEHLVLRPDGSMGWQQWDDHVIRDADGGVVEIQGIGRDITELKRAEAEAKERREQVTHLTRVGILGELSGALAHELNQPLTAILSNAQAAQRILAREPVDLAELREILGDIANDDNRAGEVIRRLRALFGRGEARLLPLDVNEVIEDTLGLVRSEVITHHVTVATAMTPGLPSVNGDRIQLQQVILNLIVNACEAMNGTDPSERSLKLSTARHDSDGAVSIAVSDRGRGFSTEVATRLFEPFYTTKEHGLGLGLSISRSIIVAHGGRLWADNSPDGGATFFVVLPGIGVNSGDQPGCDGVRRR